jgi:hypothetical protein
VLCLLLLVPSATADAAPDVLASPPFGTGSSTVTFADSVNPENLPTNAYYRFGLDSRYTPGHAPGAPI